MEIGEADRNIGREVSFRSVCSMCCAGIRVLQDSVRRPTDWIERMSLVVSTSAIWI